MVEQHLSRSHGNGKVVKMTLRGRCHQRGVLTQDAFGGSSMYSSWTGG